MSEAISKQGRYVSSAATAKIASKAEASILTTLAVSLSDAFSEILTFLLDWDDKSELNAYVAINYDFYDENITAQEMVQYFKVLQGGGLSREAYFNLLSKKETYPEDWDLEHEFNAIQEQLGALYDLPEDRYIEVTARLDKLAEYTKQLEVGATASLIAEGMSKDISGAEKIKQFEEGVVTEQIDVEENTDVNSEENVKNN